MEQKSIGKENARFSSRVRATAMLGIAACSLTMAGLEWFSPSSPPFTGKHAVVYAWAFHAWGPHGIFSVWVGLAIVLLLIGFDSLKSSGSKA